MIFYIYRKKINTFRKIKKIKTFITKTKIITIIKITNFSNNIKENQNLKMLSSFLNTRNRKTIQIT